MGLIQMSKCLLAMGVAVAAMTAARAEFSLGGSEGVIIETGGAVVFDSGRAADGTKFRYAGAHWNETFDGDFTVEADCTIERIDHWNGMRLTVSSGDWMAMVSRLQCQSGDHRFVATQKVGGQPVDEKVVKDSARSFTLVIVRRGGELVLGYRKPDGTAGEILKTAMRGKGPFRAAVNFDSAAATRMAATMTVFRVKADMVYPPAFSPAYAPRTTFGEVKALMGVNGSRNADGTYTIQPGGRLLLMAQSPISAGGWHLAWKSSGRIRIRELLLGSAETMQLGDNIHWDDIDAKVPEGYAVRGCGFASWVKRFNTDIRWPLSFFTTSGLFCFEVSPAGNEPIRFGEPVLTGEAVKAPPALVGLSEGRAPVTLTAGKGSVEFPVNAKAGAFDIVHVAGRQGDDGRELLAGWLIVYADGTTVPAFATLRWNCGVYGENGYLPSGIGAHAPQGTPDQTWFGPPGFAWGAALYEPANEHGTHWNARYAWRLVNPSPEKTVKCVQVFQYPGDRREYTVERFAAVPPERTVLALVEPGEAAFEAERPLAVNVWEWRAVPGAAKETLPLGLDKGAAADTLGEVTIRRAGTFGAGAVTVTPRVAKLDVGPVTLVCGDARSSRCSLMPVKRLDDKPFYYTMICGGHDGIGDYDRMRRLGYDEAKVHIGWKLTADETPDFSGWSERIDRIARAGMAVSVRNLFHVPEAFSNRLVRLKTTSLADGKVSDLGRWNIASSADPFYRRKLVEYYRTVGAFAAAHPAVKGINANYGLRVPSFRCTGDGGELAWDDARVAGFRDWLAKRGESNVPVDAAAIAAERRFWPLYSRYNEEVNDSLTREVCAAIRGAGYRGHLAFNVNFHPVNDKLSGQSFAEYLRIGETMGPASLFHETSERYSLSFVKWLAAARTFGQPYGDECCQPPPTYEQLMMAYLWMGMMQCFESNYCQWWGGRPAPENVAQLKAYHRLMYDAEYLPDPVCLALSLETGHDEVPRTIKEAKGPGGLHQPVMSHYGLASCLRELNVNADRYMIDAFPEKDANVRTKLLVDDITRAMPKGFADRIERFVRAGGAYLASIETDMLNGRAFLKRFGFTDDELTRTDAEPFPTVERQVGAGRVVVLRKGWSFGWDPGRPADYCRAALEKLTELGAFEPLVQANHPCVSTTPYRAKDGSALVSVINIGCEDHQVEVTMAKSLAGERPPKVFDLGTGADLPVREQNGRWSVTANVSAINTTVLRVRSK